MKRLVVFAVCLLLSLVSWAAPDSSAKVSVSADTVKKETVAAKPVKGGSTADDSAVVGKEEERSSVDLLSMISLILSALALLSAGVLFFLLRKDLLEKNNRRKKAIDKLTQRFDDHLNRDSFQRNSDDIASLKLSLKSLDTRLSHLEVDFSEKTAVSQGNSDGATSTESASAPYVPVTCFGVYKPRFKGIPSDGLTDYPSPNSTIKLVTESESTARVFFVDGLDKTQFGFLSENADLVEVIDGNVKNYSTISLVEPGRAELEGDAWVMKQVIQVRLS